MKKALFLTGVVAAAIVIAGGYYAMGPSTKTAGGEDFGYSATPMGITLQPLGAAQGYGAQRLVFSFRNEIVYSNEKGLTLYTYDKDEPGKSNCGGECTKSWIPAAPPADAKPVRDWTVIARSDGTRQWARKGQPLYTSVKDKEGGEIVGEGEGTGGGFQGGGGNRASEGRALIAKLPDGWHAAKFQTNGVPVTGIAPPLGFAIKEVTDANAVVIVDYRDMTVYAFDGDINDDKIKCVNAGGPCVGHFTPVAAPILANPAGDWTALMRADGVKQWVYKGKPLYTFDGDAIAGDVHGAHVDKRWHLASIESYFLPANVTFREDAGRGRILATADGKTLYRRDLNAFNPASIQVAHDRPYRPRIGRMIRGVACDVECQKVWRPYPAPADAQPNGYWGVAVLADGSKQWTYKDFALYTYAGDKKPGDMTGDSIYDVYVSDDPNKNNDRGFPALYQAGFFWTFATL